MWGDGDGNAAVDDGESGGVGEVAADGADGSHSRGVLDRAAFVGGRELLRFRVHAGSTGRVPAYLRSIAYTAVVSLLYDVQSKVSLHMHYA